MHFVKHFYQKSFLASAEVKRVGDGIFTYAGYYRHGIAKSLWLLNFFNGVEFLSILREKTASALFKNCG